MNIENYYCSLLWTFCLQTFYKKTLRLTMSGTYFLLQNNNSLYSPSPNDGMWMKHSRLSMILSNNSSASTPS